MVAAVIHNRARGRTMCCRVLDDAVLALFLLDLVGPPSVMREGAGGRICGVDLGGFFYHSGSKSCRVIEVVSIVHEWYKDDENGGGAVDVKAAGEMRKPLDLKEMKKELEDKGFGLSVVPVPEDFWVKICELGDRYEGNGACLSDEDKDDE